jgi:hypothetical protein
MTTILFGSARPRQTFFVVGVASRAVSVRFYSGMVRSDGSTFLASAPMTTKAPKQAFVVAIYSASLSP